MKRRKNKKTDSTKFWCTGCGSPNIRGYYSYRGSGCCRVTQVEQDGTPFDYDDYDNNNEDDWELTDVECEDCRKSGGPEEIITTNIDDVKDKKHFRWE